VPNQTDSRLGFKPVLKGLALLVILGGLIMLARALGLESHLADRQWMLEHVQGQGARGVLFFIGVAALASALGVPRQLPAFLSGLLFGAVGGCLATTLATTLGCALDFTIARTLGRDFVISRFGKRVTKLDAFLKTGPFRTSLAIRLAPVGHNLLTSAAAGVTSIAPLPFFLGSAVGYLPQNFVFALFGAGVNAESSLGRGLTIAASVLLLVGSAWLGLSVYRAYKRQGVALDEVGEMDGETDQK